MKKKNVLIISIILIIVVLAISGYLVIKNKEKKDRKSVV